MRYFTPVQDRYRILPQDAEVAGVPMKAGQRCQFLPASGNRDETAFKDPDEFLLTRGDGGKHLSFGYGIHFCVGAGLARLEAHTALRILLSLMTGLRLTEGHPIAWTPHTHLRSLAALWLDFDTAI
jgi:cytochrome P450